MDDVRTALLARVSAAMAAYRALPAVMREALDAGCSVEEVAAAAGVNRTTVWRRTGWRRGRPLGGGRRG